jgi:hypothetical protein
MCVIGHSSSCSSVVGDLCTVTSALVQTLFNVCMCVQIDCHCSLASSSKPLLMLCNVYTYVYVQAMVRQQSYMPLWHTELH